MHLELSDEETAALIRELHDIVESDRFPLSRVKTQLRDESRNIRRLREIRQKLQVSVDLTLQPNTFIQRHLSYCCELDFSDGT
jgi:hypothetical protein